MKKVLLMLVILFVAFIAYQNLSVPVNDFESCINAGNSAMESYPRQCADKGVTYIEDISVLCTNDQRDVDACTLNYEPVCATVIVQCITSPCDPVKETFSNSCSACSNQLVESYVPGECIQ